MFRIGTGDTPLRGSDNSAALCPCRLVPSSPVVHGDPSLSIANTAVLILFVDAVRRYYYLVTSR